uniref:ANK_REP_REGION domain-containing protein n=1 Tax=Macrostomum lignano TaxID=282301 RepID=A0A1I8FM52_9PLAT
QSFPDHRYGSNGLANRNCRRGCGADPLADILNRQRRHEQLMSQKRLAAAPMLGYSSADQPEVDCSGPSNQLMDRQKAQILHLEEANRRLLAMRLAGNNHNHHHHVAADEASANSAAGTFLRQHARDLAYENAALRSRIDSLTAELARQSAEFEQKLAAAEYAAAQAEEAATVAASKANKKTSKKKPPPQTAERELAKCRREQRDLEDFLAQFPTLEEVAKLKSDRARLLARSRKYKQRCATQNQRLDEQAKQLSEQQVANERLTTLLPSCVSTPKQLGTVEDTTIVGECWLTGRPQLASVKAELERCRTDCSARLAEKEAALSSARGATSELQRDLGENCNANCWTAWRRNRAKANRLDQLTDAGWRRADNGWLARQAQPVDELTSFVELCSQLADGRSRTWACCSCLGSSAETTVSQCESADEIEDQQQQQQQVDAQAGTAAVLAEMERVRALRRRLDAARRAVAARVCRSAQRPAAELPGAVTGQRLRVLHRDDLGDTGDSAGQQNDFWALVTPEIAQSLSKPATPEPTAAAALQQPTSAAAVNQQCAASLDDDLDCCDPALRPAPLPQLLLLPRPPRSHKISQQQPDSNSVGEMDYGDLTATQIRDVKEGVEALSSDCSLNFTQNVVAESAAASRGRELDPLVTTGLSIRVRPASPPQAAFVGVSASALKASRRNCLMKPIKTVPDAARLHTASSTSSGGAGGGFSTAGGRGCAGIGQRHGSRPKPWLRLLKNEDSAPANPSTKAASTKLRDAMSTSRQQMPGSATTPMLVLAVGRLAEHASGWAASASSRLRLLRVRSKPAFKPAPCPLLSSAVAAAAPIAPTAAAFMMAPPASQHPARRTSVKAATEKGPGETQPGQTPPCRLGERVSLSAFPDSRLRPVSSRPWTSNWPAIFVSLTALVGRICSRSCALSLGFEAPALTEALVSQSFTVAGMANVAPEGAQLPPMKILG